MTPLHLILRDSAVVLPFVAVGALVFGGPMLAGGVVLAGVVSVLNLALMGLLIERIARSTASGESAGLAGAVLSGKLFALLAAFGWLMLAFPPLSVPLGLGSVIGGLSLHPLLQRVWPSPSVGTQES